MGDNQLDRDGEMTPDARLSAAEQAALDHLEAVAMADDPRLANRLKGANASRALAAAPRVLPVGRLLWTAACAAGWWGAPLVVLGLLLMAVGLSAGLVPALVGAAACALGLRMLAGLVERRARPAP